MTSINNPEFDLRDLRSYYEEQGRMVLAADGVISCSEKSNVDVVARMIDEYGNEVETVVDVGCGANLVYLKALTSSGKHVVGVDFAFNFLKLASQGSSAVLIQGDATHLPFCAESFDAVVCSETVEHIPDEIAVINELARVLRPGGLLFFTVPILWNAGRIIQMVKCVDPHVHLMTGHLREYSLKKVTRLLEGRFAIQKIYPVGFGWSGRFGGRIERLIARGTLARFGRSVALAARKI